MNTSIKLLSVNIEGDKHIDKIIRLIKKVQPDVLCMQEVFSNDLETFSEIMGENYIYSPTFSEREDNNGEVTQFGNVIFTKLPVTKTGEEYYYLNKENLCPYAGDYKNMALVASFVDAEKSGEMFRIATTHFMKSKNGNNEDEFQMQQVPGLMRAIENLKSFVVCGDFNAPRGMSIFDGLAKKYKDNIDQKYEVSLDPDLHAVGPLPFMVDGLFSTPEYEVKNMYFETGVSDHYAIVADVYKK